MATRFVVAPVVTDSFGFSTVSVAVPSEPALVGVGFALQAFLVRASDRSSAITNGLHVTLGY